MPTTHPGHPSRRWRATCVVVTPGSEGEAGPGSVAELEQSLRNRELTVRRAADPFDAMADVMLHERDRRQNRPVDPMVVVLVEPALLPEAGALFDTAQRHAPRVVFWEYQTGPGARLIAYRRTPPDPHRTESIRSTKAPAPSILARGAPPGPDTPPVLRLTPQHANAPPLAQPAGRAPERDAAEPSASILSDEELSMLLGEGPSRRSRGSDA